MLGRRDFLLIAGAGALLSPAVGAYTLRRMADGDPFPLDLPERPTAESSPSPGNVTSTAPLLLLTPEDNDHPFGAYLAEILRVEGLNCFDMAPVSAATADTLGHYSVVLLGAGRLNASQVALLEGFVYRGGCLVCMRPDSKLGPLLGVERVQGEVAGGYLRVVSGELVTNGISTESLQFHGAADRYRLTEARALAWLSENVEAQADPAVTVNHYGSGHAAMWAFDLARSIAYMRQGNPALVNQDTDGLAGTRTVDMFKGWIDLDRIAVPQADEEQRLLVNLVSALSPHPMPRLWYFPGDAPGMLVATGDSHMNPAQYIEEVLELVEQRGGHISIYYSPQLVGDWGRAERLARFAANDRLPGVGRLLAHQFRSPTPGLVKSWRARGHEFTVHPWVEEGPIPGWRRYWLEFTGRQYGPVSSTVRTHRILWSGWTETARVQAACGIRMNMDYYHVGPSLRTTRGEWVYGHLTGSGQPMKFVSENGTILDIYQQNTQLADEHLLGMDVPGWGGWPDLSAGEAVELSRAMLHQSIKNGHYSPIAVQFHVDPFQVGGEAADKARAWIEGTLDAARDIGVPIWSAERWLQFTDTRQSARFEQIEWHPDKKHLKMRLNASSEAGDQLAVLIPLWHEEVRVCRIKIDGSPVGFGERIVGGVRYASTAVRAEPHQVTAVYG